MTEPEVRQILTVEQAAELLQVPVKTCRSLSARGAIPAFKLGRVWRFVRQELEAWATAQALANVRPELAGGVARRRPELVKSHVPAGSLAERLDALLEGAAAGTQTVRVGKKRKP